MTVHTGPNARAAACGSPLALAKAEATEVRVLLMGDAVACAKPGQTTPEGAHNVGRMLKGLTERGVRVGPCGSCLDARVFSEADIADGVHRSSMAELAAWTLGAERTLVI